MSVSELPVIASTPSASRTTSLGTERQSQRAATTHLVPATLEVPEVHANASATVAAMERDAVTVSGLPAERIVALLTDARLPFSELGQHRVLCTSARRSGRWLSLSRLASGLAR